MILRRFSRWRIKAIIQPSISLQNNLLTQRATKCSGQDLEGSKVNHNHSNLNIPTSSESSQISDQNQENLMVCSVLLVFIGKIVFTEANDGRPPRPGASLPYSNFFVTNCERCRKASSHTPSHRRLKID